MSFIFKNEESKVSTLSSSRLRYLHFYYIICAFIIPFYLIKNQFQYSEHEWNWLLVPLFGLFLLSPVLGRYFKSYLRVAYWTAISSTTILSILLYEAGGLDAPGLIWLSAIPMTFGVLLGKRGGLVGGFLMLSIIGLFNFLETLGYSGSIHFSPELLAREKITNIITFGLYCVLSVDYFLKNEFNANQEIEKQRNEVETLLRVLIHDIATPLSVSNMLADKIIQTNPSKEIMDSLLMRLKASQASAGRILSEIRTVRAYRDGKKTLQFKHIDLKSQINDCLFILSTLAEKKNIAIEVMAPDATYFALADETIFKVIVFSNLITNSLKFSNTGSKILVELYQNEKNVTLKVRDFGIGIPQEIINNLWETQAATNRTGTSGEVGTGYGMPLVKEFTEKMGGTIAIQSSEIDLPDFKQGTEFSLSFQKKS